MKLADYGLVGDDNVGLLVMLYEGMEILKIETTAGIIVALEDRSLSNGDSRRTRRCGGTY